MPAAPGPALALAAGNFHTCALLRDASVQCWGMGRAGQLGDGAASQQGTPVRAGTLADVVQIAAEGDRSCAVRRSGEVWCWGHGASAELGDRGPTDRATPVHIPVWQHVRRLALAMDHDCAITHDGRVLCRGANLHGELGDASHDPHDMPVPALGLTRVDELGLGLGFGCALQAGQVHCWGWCADGRCGADTLADRASPTRVELPPARALAVGFDHACAVLEDSSLRCWGSNVFGQLGDGTTDTRRTPTAVPGLDRVARVAAAQHQTVAVLSDGTAHAWGRDGGDARALWPGCPDPQTRVPAGRRRNGAWATGPAEPFCPRPAPLVDLAGVAQVVTSALHACALLHTGHVLCWGSDAYGSLGDAATGDRDHPTLVAWTLSPAPPSR